MVTPAEDACARTNPKITAAMLGALLLFIGIFGTAESATATPLEEQTLEPVAEEVTPAPEEPERGAEESTPDPKATPSVETEETPTPQTFAAPAMGEAVIKVQVGGDRTSASNGAGLSGVELHLHKGAAAGPEANPVDEAWATCISDAQGVCELTVPESDFDSFWVVQAAGSDSSNEYGTITGYTSDEYQIYVGDQLRAGETYTFRKDFIREAESPKSQRMASDARQSSVNNPEPTCQLGLNIAMVLDTSDNNANRNYLKPAATGFVDQLQGTGATLALYNMGSNTAENNGNNGKNQNLAPRAIDVLESKAQIINQINNYTPGGSPNWESTLWQVDADSASKKYDLVVVITGGDTNSADEAISAANALKATGSRVIAIGAGTGFSDGVENLQAISGPTGYEDAASAANADYALLSWNKLNSFMSALAEDLKCEPTLEPKISIKKHGWDTPTAEGLEGAKELVSEKTKVTNGQQITWTYEVTNTGETVLNNIEVIDDTLDDDAVECPSESLQVGESMTCTASGAVMANR